jgi:DNA repair protein RadC
MKAVIQRIEDERKKQIKSIAKPEDIVTYCADMQDLQQKEFRVLLLNTKNKILAQKRIFLNETYVRSVFVILFKKES